MIKTNITKVAVGVDIAKDMLDIYIYPVGETLRIKNSQSGVKQLLNRLAKYEVQQVVCESSGGYEYLAVKTMQALGYKVWVVDPKRIKAYREAKGCKAKTDAIEAKHIALFAMQEKPVYSPKILSDVELQMRALAVRRLELNRLISNEKKREKQIVDHYCLSSIKRIIKTLTKELQKIDTKMKVLIEAQVDLQSKATILSSMPGIGKITAHSLIALMPELGSCEGKKIAALLGVAPYVKQSGKSNCKACVSGGRGNARQILYMASLSAAHSNSPFGIFYKRLREAGKPPKVALVALMRKMIIISNIMLQRNQIWIPQC